MKHDPYRQPTRPHPKPTRGKPRQIVRWACRDYLRRRRKSAA